MKSIKTKILLSIILIVVIISTAIGGVSCYQNYKGTMHLLEQATAPSAQMAAEAIYSTLDGYMTALVETAASDTFRTEAPTSQNIINESKAIAERNFFESVGKADINGNSSSGNNVADREYFQQCKATKQSVISDIIVSKADGSLVFVFAVPILKNNNFDGIVYGTIDAAFLTDITNKLKLGTSGVAYVLDKHGDTIAHPNKEEVLNQSNTIETAKTDQSMQSIAAAQNEMIQGKTGFAAYTYQGTQKILSYAPIEGSDGWSVGIAADRAEFLQSMKTGILVTIVLIVIMLIAAIILAVFIANSVANPIKKCVDRLLLLEQGDLLSPVPTTNAKDETAVLLNTLGNTVSSLNLIVEDIRYLLEEIANGNFDIRTKAQENYVGQFKQIVTSLRTLVLRLSSTLFQINDSADQVSNGSEQVANGSQALSQGATEQASSIEELAATINEISQQIKQNAESSNEASQKADAVGLEANDSNQRMQDMLSAIKDINESSNKISKIIKTIEDIAFQTNILALNAAVEAARAGAAGKGFAVVADEVRNLANKSAEASKNTAVLIEESLKAVENGTEIADRTAQSLLNVVSGVAEVTETISQISDASIQQAQSIAQITQGIDQISSVVQTNSATAEESAAASEELSGQAQMLKSLVSQFQLRIEADTNLLQNKPIEKKIEYSAFSKEENKY